MQLQEVLHYGWLRFCLNDCCKAAIFYNSDCQTSIWCWIIPSEMVESGVFCRWLVMKTKSMVIAIVNYCSMNLVENYIVGDRKSGKNEWSHLGELPIWLMDTNFHITDNLDLKLEGSLDQSNQNWSMCHKTTTYQSIWW